MWPSSNQLLKKQNTEELTTNQAPVNIIGAVIKRLVTPTAEVIHFFEARVSHMKDF